MPKKTKKTPSKFNRRSPVITIMGHIDHGKTTLLDALRNSHLQSQESGGITQHVGAYQITHQGRCLTFIDTPGHAAFAAMRSRGAQVTDLVILVIDAVESVKPQTKECLAHIKKAKVPFIVAINKMDLPNAVPDIVKKDLADSGVLVEGYGGDIVTVPISAKTKHGLKELLEMVVLLTDMQDLQAHPNHPLKAVIIESSLDQGQGALATVILKEGTLAVRDKIQAGSITGTVKALFSPQGQALKKVFPGHSAQVLGFKKVPAVGEIMTSSLKQTRSTAQSLFISTPNPTALESKPTLKILLKADAVGTLEAITQNLGDDVSLIASGVGNITESDILLAQSTQAQIITFRVKVSSAAQKLAEIEGIFIKTYSLIHRLLDDLQQQILKMLEPTIDEQELGTATVLAEFTAKGEKIAGCQILSGKFSLGDQVHLLRNQDQLADAKIKSIRIGKQIVEKAKKGDQCGLAFTTSLDFKPKDKLSAFKNIL